MKPRISGPISKRTIKGGTMNKKLYSNLSPVINENYRIKMEKDGSFQSCIQKF